MGGELLAHVVLVVVRGQDGVDVLDCERIEDVGDVAEVGLHGADAGHVGHLVTGLHEAVAVAALAVAGPEVDGDLGTAGGLHEHAGAAEPPHLDGARLDNVVLHVLVQPRAPLRERVHDPLLARDLVNC